MGLLEQVIDEVKAGSSRIQNYARGLEESLFENVQERVDNITEKAHQGLKSDISFADRQFLNALYL